MAVSFADLATAARGLPGRSRAPAQHIGRKGDGRGAGRDHAEAEGGVVCAGVGGDRGVGVGGSVGGGGVAQAVWYGPGRGAEQEASERDAAARGGAGGGGVPPRDRPGGRDGGG